MKYVIVTGASKGIGLAVAKKLLIHNYKIHAIARTETHLERVYQDLKVIGDFSYSTLDLSNLEKVEKFTKAWIGKIYGIVNNAGCWKEELLVDEKNNSIQEIFKLNVFGLYNFTKGMIANISNPGRIINISSQLGTTGRTGMGAYTASKHAVIGLTKCWSLELIERGILVNTVSPGWVLTNSNLTELEEKEKKMNLKKDSLIKEISKDLHLKRFISTEEVANLISFLISNEASGITGKNFEIK